MRKNHKMECGVKDPSSRGIVVVAALTTKGALFGEEDVFSLFISFPPCRLRKGLSRIIILQNNIPQRIVSLS